VKKDMNRGIDVRNEMRKLASSKPVHAAAGVGVVASQTLRELPARLAGLHLETTMVELPARATEYVLTARAKAAGEYERLAELGRQAMGGQAAVPAVPAPANGRASEGNGKATPVNGKAAPRGTATRTARTTRTAK
jgi:hypothetical protein